MGRFYIIQGYITNQGRRDLGLKEAHGEVCKVCTDIKTYWLDIYPLKIMISKMNKEAFSTRHAAECYLVEQLTETQTMNRNTYMNATAKRKGG